MRFKVGWPKKYPSVMVDSTWKPYGNYHYNDGDGPKLYGARQIMNITDPKYLYYAARIINNMISHVAEASGCNRLSGRQ